MNLNLKNVEANTVSITDYKLVASKLARVVVAFTGRHTKESLTDAICAKLKHLAAPVEGSFRMVKNNVAVGFIRAHTEVRPVTENELRASYRVMSANGASNIMMDNADKTLWEVKEGVGGRFLARSGAEDLSELVSASVNRRPDVVRLNQLSRMTASRREFVAFASESGDMEYGFCVGARDGALRVVSSTTGTAKTIPEDAVVTVQHVQIPVSAHKKIVAAGISREDAKQEIEYYTRLYSYSPEYLSKVIDQIEGTATM